MGCLVVRVSVTRCVGSVSFRFFAASSFQIKNYGIPKHNMFWKNFYLPRPYYFSSSLSVDMLHQLHVYAIAY